jgi:hypothetical protein
MYAIYSDFIQNISLIGTLYVRKNKFNKIVSKISNLKPG